MSVQQAYRIALISAHILQVSTRRNVLEHKPCDTTLDYWETSRILILISRPTSACFDMPPKRRHSPELLSPAKRRRIQSWLDPADDPRPFSESAMAPDKSPASNIQNLDGASEISRSVNPAAQTETSRTGYTQLHYNIALRERLILAAEPPAKPANWDTIKALFAAARCTPEPSFEDYQLLEKNIHQASTEEQVRTKVFSKYIKESWYGNAPGHHQLGHHSQST